MRLALHLDRQRRHAEGRARHELKGCTAAPAVRSELKRAHLVRVRVRVGVRVRVWVWVRVGVTVWVWVWVRVRRVWVWVRVSVRVRVGAHPAAQPRSASLLLRGHLARG